MPDEFDLSRRKALAALGTVGAASASAGLGTSAFFSDQETFENNQLDAGEFDLKVDWEVNYYDWLAPDPETISDSDTDDDGDLEFVDDPGPIVDLEDVKPGDVIEHTISLHLFGNPGFIAMDGLLTADSDNGFTEPENDVDGTTDDADGTPDGDLDDHLQCVVWFDDGDGLPQEIWSTTPFPSKDEFLRNLTAGDVSFDTTADEFVFQGTLASLMTALSGGLLLDARATDHVAMDFSDSSCFEPSTTQHLGILCWLPRDIPGVDDNIVQSDRLEYELGFDAIQCRHNVADDGRPIERPTGDIEPLTFEVTEGFGTLGGGPINLQSDVGFPENMVTSVDTSGDPVEFVLDVPQELGKSAGDRWSLVFDADDDGTVDFRIVFDEVFYQEWDDEQGEWGEEQPVPAEIETGVVDGIYVVEIPRDRLSDPFSFAGRLIYHEPPPISGFQSNEELAVGLTPTLAPRDELGPKTGGFERIVISTQMSNASFQPEPPEMALLSNKETQLLWDAAKETKETQDVMEIARETYGLTLDTSRKTARSLQQDDVGSNVLTVPLTDGDTKNVSRSLYIAHFDDEKDFQMAGIFLAQREINGQRITKRVTQSFSHVDEEQRRDASAIIQNGKLVEFQDPGFEGGNASISTVKPSRGPAQLSGSHRVLPQHGDQIQFPIGSPGQAGLQSSQLSLASAGAAQQEDWIAYLEAISCGVCTLNINTIVSILSTLGCNAFGIGASISVGGAIGTSSGGPGAGTAGGATVGGVLASVLCGVVSEYSVESITTWVSGLTDCCICYYFDQCDACSGDCPRWVDKNGSVAHGTGAGPETGDESPPETFECECNFNPRQSTTLTACDCNKGLPCVSGWIEIRVPATDRLFCYIQKVVITGLNKCEGGDGCYNLDEPLDEVDIIEYNRSAPPSEDFGSGSTSGNFRISGSFIQLKLPCLIPPKNCEPLEIGITVKLNSRPNENSEGCKWNGSLSLDRFGPRFECPDEGEGVSSDFS